MFNSVEMAKIPLLTLQVICDDKTHDKIHKQLRAYPDFISFEIQYVKNSGNYWKLELKYRGILQISFLKYEIYFNRLIMFESI